MTKQAFKAAYSIYRLERRATIMGAQATLERVDKIRLAAGLKPLLKAVTYAYHMKSWEPLG